MDSMAQPLLRSDSSGKSASNSLENFLKVEIRSAALNMKKGDKIYILLSLKKADHHELQLRSELATRNANSNPEWNQKLFFSVPENSILEDNYSISCKIVKARKFLPDYEIGETGTEINYLFPVGAAREEEDVPEEPRNGIPDPDYIYLDDHENIYRNEQDNQDDEDFYNAASRNTEEFQLEQPEKEEIFKLKASVNLPITKGCQTIGALSAVFTAWWAKKSTFVAGGNGGEVNSGRELHAEIYRDASFRLGTMKMERAENMQGDYLVGGAHWSELAMDSEELMMTKYGQISHEKTKKQPRKPKSLGISCFPIKGLKD